MNAVSPIYYLHMAFKAVKVTIILAWKKNFQAQIQAEHLLWMYKVARFLQLEARNFYFFLTFLSKVQIKQLYLLLEYLLKALIFYLPIYQ